METARNCPSVVVTYWFWQVRYSDMSESEAQDSYASVEREVGDLLLNIGQMLCDNVPNEPQRVRVPVDSKLRREQWAKDHAVNLTM